MNLYREDNQFLVVAIAAMILLAVGIGIILLKPEKSEVASEPAEEWCEVGQVMTDGTIIYQGYGQTELVMFATADGPKLMSKCE